MIRTIAQKAKEDIYNGWPKVDFEKFTEDAQVLIAAHDLSAFDINAIVALVRRVPARYQSSARLTISDAEMNDDSMDAGAIRDKIASLIQVLSLVLMLRR